jgi:hypothetical protein
MSTNGKKRRRVLELFHRQRGKCWYCREPMLQPPQGGWALPAGGKLHPKAATLEHLFDRYHPERGMHAGDGVQCHVAACHECNSRRAHERTLEITMADRQQRSGRYPEQQRRAAE